MNKEQENMEEMAQMEAQEPWMWDAPPGIPAPVITNEQAPVQVEMPKIQEVTA